MEQDLNQKIANILGAMAAQSPMSVAANTARKMYMGWCKLGSVGMVISKMIFPKRATRHTAKKGNPIQNCTCSSPGIPIKITVMGFKYDVLKDDREVGILCSYHCF